MNARGGGGIPAFKRTMKSAAENKAINGYGEQQSPHVRAHYLSKPRGAA
jgi:hypothetical protein